MMNAISMMTPMIGSPETMKCLTVRSQLWKGWKPMYRRELSLFLVLEEEWMTSRKGVWRIGVYPSHNRGKTILWMQFLNSNAPNLELAAKALHPVKNWKSMVQYHPWHFIILPPIPGTEKTPIIGFICFIQSRDLTVKTLIVSGSNHLSYLLRIKVILLTSSCNFSQFEHKVCELLYSLTKREIVEAYFEVYRRQPGVNQIVVSIQILA